MKQNTIDDILTDLPKIQAIANMPMMQHPTLPMILSLAQALAQVGQWAVDAQQIVLSVKAERPAAEGDEFTVRRTVGRTTGMSIERDEDGQAKTVVEVDPSGTVTLPDGMRIMGCEAAGGG